MQQTPAMLLLVCSSLRRRNAIEMCAEPTFIAVFAHEIDLLAERGSQVRKLHICAHRWSGQPPRKGCIDRGLHWRHVVLAGVAHLALLEREH